MCLVVAPVFSAAATTPFSATVASVGVVAASMAATVVSVSVTVVVVVVVVIAVVAVIMITIVAAIIVVVLVSSLPLLVVLLVILVVLTYIVMLVLVPMQLLGQNLLRILFAALEVIDLGEVVVVIMRKRRHVPYFPVGVIDQGARFRDRIVQALGLGLWGRNAMPP